MVDDGNGSENSFEMNRTKTVKERIAERMVKRSSMVPNRGSIGNAKMAAGRDSIVTGRNSVVNGRNSIQSNFCGFDDPYTRRTEGHFRPARVMRTSGDYNREFTV